MRFFLYLIYLKPFQLLLWITIRGCPWCFTIRMSFSSVSPNKAQRQLPPTVQISPVHPYRVAPARTRPLEWQPPSQPSDSWPPLLFPQRLPDMQISMTCQSVHGSFYSTPIPANSCWKSPTIIDSVVCEVSFECTSLSQFSDSWGLLCVFRRRFFHNFPGCWIYYEGFFVSRFLLRWEAHLDNAVRGNGGRLFGNLVPFPLTKKRSDTSRAHRNEIKCFYELLGVVGVAGGLGSHRRHFSLQPLPA